MEYVAGRVLDAKAWVGNYGGARRYILGETLCQRLARGFARAQPDGPALLA
jgi:hypothetical protein